MKTILITITLALTSLFINAQDDPGTDTVAMEGISITVNVPVSGDKGNVIFGLFTEENFMTGAPVQGLESEIVDGKASVTFTNVTPGTYAVTLLHDTNGNKRMDYDANGMPLEMYGVSNNIMSMGPPLWSDAKFEVENEPLTLDIIM
ncbi:MAG: DUF2141 domain-containing protein [Bacteroidia bacterium]|nr:DUF2141 domain-containing protein [Bacteroidia bacterium]NNF30864.1 DUF2141 domain-containing protein [Flavobacteriaceae bacterium]MBT8275430.1 DUF2141 domain-containing protein [Bacteroidia bacterium]NNJ81941.1 DUF2141 domain-containing protein [Flavobacteriaceae bacterium]NNK54477.1 DUF2141 domain-containing protein [Flavobacteriaceae bacterium]